MIQHFPPLPSGKSRVGQFCCGVESGCWCHAVGGPAFAEVLDGMQPQFGRRIQPVQNRWSVPGDRYAFGIRLRPACVHMPSGNVVVQLATPRGGPFDPAPVFPYNSPASISNLGRGYGVLDLFHPTVEQRRDVTSLITGTGRCLEYTGVGEGTWGTIPASVRRLCSVVRVSHGSISMA